MIYIIRHGQTDWNLKNKLQGHTDIPLNEEGIKQAYAAKELLKDIKIDMVFSSPLKRAVQTSKIISTSKTILEDRLLERGYGHLEGNHKSTYNKNHLWNIDTEKNFSNIETMQELEERVFSFLDEIKQYKDKNILIVSHAGTMRMIMKYFKGMPESNNMLDFSVENGVVHTLEY